jgi:peroxiredoxin Q/BCP
MPKNLEVGDVAPAFEAIAVGAEYGEGRKVLLSDFRGKPVVLYFYPKDDTPGCTKQACALRDSWTNIKNRAALFGVSVDPVKSHTRFIEKYQLPFPLLSDSERKIVQDYGVWVEKSFMGKTSMGVERSTFVIGADGRIAAILRRVKPEEHLDLLQNALPD